MTRRFLLHLVPLLGLILTLGCATAVAPGCTQATCDSNATCDDSGGEPVCTCNTGFDGDGQTCASTCGDGTVAVDEVCDDGYTDACGSCNADCTAVGSGATCGDSESCQELEVCDDGFTDACGDCNADCSGIGIPPGPGTAVIANTGVGRGGTVQAFVVPPCITSLSIEARGAKGGGAVGGAGAIVAGDFSVTPGEVLQILVGQMGTVTSQGPAYGAGGGGGTFVYRDANDALPMIAAAGGGGQSEYGFGLSASGGVGSGTEVTTAGAGTGSGPGGTGGNGGAGGLNIGSYSTGGGGCGWMTNGDNGLLLRNPEGVGGQAPRNGGLGGLFTHPSNYTGDGGFGGGGGNSDNTGAGGGGGGFNGGGGGNNYAGTGQWGSAGGGGSYNGGLNQNNQSGTNNDHGRVGIAW